MGHLNGYPRKCNFLIINKLQIRLKLGCQSQETSYGILIVYFNKQNRVNKIQFSTKTAKNIHLCD